MARYRIIKPNEESAYLLQKKRIFFGGWKTINTWMSKDYAYSEFFKLTGYLESHNQVIIDSDNMAKKFD